MNWREAAWFIAGFSLAVTMTVELGTPYAYLVFACGFVTRGLGALVIKQVYGADLTTLWKRYKPKQAQYWRHAWAYIKGHHPEADPLICNHCNG